MTIKTPAGDESPHRGFFYSVSGMMNKAAAYIIHLIFCGFRDIIYDRFVCEFC